MNTEETIDENNMKKNRAGENIITQEITSHMIQNENEEDRKGCDRETNEHRTGEDRME